MFTCSAVRSVERRRSSARSVWKVCEPRAGGGGGRNAAPEEMTHVRQAPALGSNGELTNLAGVGRQSALPVGTDPAHVKSDPSLRAHAITRAATARPSA